MSFSLTKALVLIQALLVLASLECDGGILGTKIYVTMRNALDEDKNMTAHCKSKSSDLGSHELATNKTYGFNFKVKNWDSALYSCDLTWDEEAHPFNIFMGKRDKGQCTHCNWIIKDSGPCRNGPRKKEACFPWD